MEMPTSQNGTAPAAAKTATLTLEFDYATFALKISGSAENNDVFMNMVQMAQRYFETMMRLSAAQQFKQQSLEQARNQAIAEQVLRKV